MQNTAYLFRDTPYFENCPLECNPIAFLLFLVAEMRSVLYDRRRREWAWSETAAWGGERGRDKGENKEYMFRFAQLQVCSANVVGSRYRERAACDYIFEWAGHTHLRNQKRKQSIGLLFRFWNDVFRTRNVMRTACVMTASPCGVRFARE